MKTSRITILFTIYILAILVSAQCGMTESVVKDVAAIPPTPISAGMHLGAPAALVVIAFVVAWFI